MILQGQASRQVAAHNLNSQSSRSHTIFSVWLDTVDAGQCLLSFEQGLSACSLRIRLHARIMY